FLHPHARPAGPAAQRTIPVTRHLDRTYARHLLQRRARIAIHTVVASEVAGVVVGERGGDPAGRSQAPLGDQVREQLRVVDHLEPPAVIGVLVAQGVEAVWAVRDYLRDAGAGERLHV